jgi:methanogen extracellular protein (TIGR04279 family)
MKKEMLLRAQLCLILACLFPAALCAEGSTSLADNPIGGEWITLQDASIINIPSMNIETTAKWRYPYLYIPVYHKNQTIKGMLIGSSSMAGSKVSLSIASFDPATFLKSFPAKESGGKMRGNLSHLLLNRSGYASFTLNETNSGMYTISVADENDSTILSILPLLVTPGELSLDAPAKIAAGDVLILKANLSASENASKIFAAMMISRTDYKNASVNLNMSGTKGDINSTLFLGNKSVTLRGVPSISSESLMQIIALLPADSAVGMQETNGDGAEIILLTGPEWEKGSYILICGVYSPGKGLSAIKEMEIEVI